MELEPFKFPFVTIQSTKGAPGDILQVAKISVQVDGLPLIISEASVVSTKVQTFPVQIVAGGCTSISGSGGRLISMGSTVAELDPQGLEADICTSKALI